MEGPEKKYLPLRTSRVMVAWCGGSQGSLKGDCGTKVVLFIHYIKVLVKVVIIRFKCKMYRFSCKACK